MDRLSPLDAAFLDLEDDDPHASLAIASAGLFAGPPPPQDEIAATLAARLPRIPRYRQKVRTLPLDLGNPVWMDDPAFDLAYHLRRTALPAPGGDPELYALLARVMALRLDRDHPLWEYWVVEGLAGGRWALISKLHHCMVDGVSGTSLYDVVTDASPDGGPPTNAPARTATGAPTGRQQWTPRPSPSTVRLLGAAAADLARVPGRNVEALVRSARHPRHASTQLARSLRGALGFAAAVLPSTSTTVVGPIGHGRRYAVARIEMADVGRARRAYGGTVNDLALAAIAAGFRDVLVARGEHPGPQSVRSLVPVSVRAPDGHGVLDNQVSAILAWLPVDEPDPVERLARVRRHMDELKATHEAETGQLFTSVLGIEPYLAVALGTRLVFRAPQWAIDTVTTNVPGPRDTRYLLGRELLEIVPYVPIANQVRIGIAITSYRGLLTFGVTGDFDAAPDVETLAAGIERGMADLLAPAEDR